MITLPKECQVSCYRSASLLLFDPHSAKGGKGRRGGAIVLSCGTHFPRPPQGSSGYHLQAQANGQAAIGARVLSVQARKIRGGYRGCAESAGQVWR